MNHVDHHPRVSVIIPAYNPGSLIVQAIESVLAQTFQDFEIIVVDDSSDDGTAERLREYQDKVRYVRQDRSGSAIARNRGILLSRGRYLAFLDADDLWMPNKLEEQLPLIEGSPNCVLVYSDFNKTGDPDDDVRSGLQAREYWVKDSEFESLLRQNFIHTSSVLVRKEALADAGIFDPKFKNAQDWDLWVRLAETGNFGFVDQILTHYRVHRNQSVATLSYARNMIYSDHVLLARWSKDADALRLIRLKTGQDYYKLGRREWRCGNFRHARHAFWQASKFDRQRIRSMVRYVYCILPGPIIHALRRSDENST